MHDAFDEGFEKAAGDKLAALKPRIETLKASMVDFKKRHDLSFTNEPAKGLVVDVNGAGGPEIQGADYSAALLSICRRTRVSRPACSGTNANDLVAACRRDRARLRSLGRSWQGTSDAHLTGEAYYWQSAIGLPDPLYGT